MSVRPWMQVQPDFPDDVLGLLMSTYYGGRSEVKLRRKICRVLYADFPSMYPTCCVLLGLWRYLVAESIVARDVTEEIRTLLPSLTVDEFQKPSTWRRMAAIVQLDPEDDLLPLRGLYGESSSPTIGLNFVSGEGQPMWYALPDVVNAATNTGCVPRVLRAIGFEPGPLQEGLTPIDLMGNPAYRVDPATDDVIRRLIELRSDIRARRKAAARAGQMEEAVRLEAEQHALNRTTRPTRLAGMRG